MISRAPPAWLAARRRTRDAATGLPAPAADVGPPPARPTLTPVAADVFSRKHFLEILPACPVFAANYVKLLSLRLMQVEREFAGLIHAWAFHRLAKELLHLAEDIGEDTGSGTRIALKLTHEDLANLVGVARETVTIQLRKFEEMGLIRREGRTLVVNRARLRDYVRVKNA